ncbi:hypothetical protein MHYP_G00363180 [Metynnis hypsauchen]
MKKRELVKLLFFVVYFSSSIFIRMTHILCFLEHNVIVLEDIGSCVSLMLLFIFLARKRQIYRHKMYKVQIFVFSQAHCVFLDALYSQ